MVAKQDCLVNSLNNSFGLKMVSEEWQFSARLKMVSTY
ncbi:hypothetical protein PSYMP_26503, partial [Pseudomonas amygdali pv. morsprunorum str. M302280]